MVEIEFGARWLVRVVEMYPNARVVAVGVKARDTLESIGVDAPLVPHPSRGSDEKLIKNLERVAEKLRAVGLMMNGIKSQPGRDEASTKV